MPIELIPVREEHVPELARICCDAFGALHDRHNMPRDFPDVEIPRRLLTMLAARDDFFGVAAVEGGRLVGSNFLQTSDAVAAVGPITVDPAVQSRGVGRRLMTAVLDHAAERGIRDVRLFQEAMNAVSLSLYASLGFEWRDAAAILQLAAPGEGGPTDAPVRAMTADDLDAVGAISAERYGTTRRNEVAAALAWEFPAYVRERGGRAAAYLIPGYFGHGFAPTVEDMLALLAHAARHAPEPFQRILCPLSEGELYRACLGAGHRTLKVMNMMSVGPYTPPREVWVPSIGC